LEHFIERHPETTHCLICTDKDDAGDLVAAKIAAFPGITSERVLPTHGVDWNDAIQAVKHTTNRAQDMPERR